MAAQPNPITVTFDMKNKDSYVNLITDLRSKLGNPRHKSHNRPVLPPEQDPPSSWAWFYVVLKSSTNNVLTLASRRDNLYLVGFKGQEDKWWELREDARGARQLIAGSTLLEFGGSYRDLLGDPDKRMTELNLGPQQMTKAVNVLAAFTTASLSSAAGQKEVKDSLATLIFMVHEATRLTTVSGRVAELMQSRAPTTTGTITPQMKAQINGWGALSEELLRSDAPPKGKPFRPFPAMGVTSAVQAAATVGILKFAEVEGGMTKETAMRLFLESQSQRV